MLRGQRNTEQKERKMDDMFNREHVEACLKILETGIEFDEFEDWMKGQTTMLIGKTVWYYGHDIRRFLAGLDVID